MERAAALRAEIEALDRFSVAAGAPAPPGAQRNQPRRIIWRESQQSIGRISQFLLAVKLPTEVCAQVGVKRGTPGQLLEVSAVGGGQPRRVRVSTPEGSKFCVGTTGRVCYLALAAGRLRGHDQD